MFIIRYKVHMIERLKDCHRGNGKESLEHRETERPCAAHSDLTIRLRAKPFLEQCKYFTPTIVFI